MKSPLFSIIVPTRKINNYLLFEGLPSFKKQTFKYFEVIILSDETQHLSHLQTKYKWLKIIKTDRAVKPAKKRRIGVKKAQGQIIAFIDDDAYPDQNWLKNAQKLFNNPAIISICGPGVLAKKTNFWEKVFNQCLISFLCSGVYTYRFTPQKKRYVDDYPSMNFFIRKNIFNKLNRCNNDYWPGEDSKLCEELVYQEKNKILYSPTLIVYHHRRDNLKDFIKQHANYGFHRGSFFAHGDRNSLKITYLLPTFFVFYLSLLLLDKLYNFINLKNLLFLPSLIYLFFGLILIIKSFFHTKNVLISLLVFPVVFLTHLTYGIMFIIGLIKNKNEK